MNATTASQPATHDREPDTGPGPLDLLGLGSTELAEAASLRLPKGAGLAGTIYARAFATGRIETEGLGLSAATEAAWIENFSVGLLSVRRVVEEEGEFGPTSKALLGTADGLGIECVRIPMPPAPGGAARSTLCLSSQVGCRMGCAFCETGAGGFTRDLRAAEIVAQALTARILLGWDCNNIVFMGMGEPLDNLKEVGQAIRVLMDRRGLSYGAERITVCSSCPPGGIARLRELGLKRLNLSISLNGGLDATRSSLMPVNRAQGLDCLAEELAAYSQRRNFVLAANYCLLPGLNDGIEEARGVAAFAARVGRVLINLIPYNPGSKPLARAPTEEEIERFTGWLEAEGCHVRRRTRKGASIMAACGQLRAGDRPAAG